MNDVRPQSGLSRWGSPPEEPPSVLPDQPTFLMLMNWHDIHLPRLWRATGYLFNPLLIEAMMAQIAVPRSAAACILHAFNQLTGEHYQLEQLRVALIEGEEARQ
ncbi:MAG: hypothetical protein J2P37_09265 [Ktedonobacteraceae bacterium]|jgi:hypothetical protein|nr:hypothetical protein [Ktedonobacteraceae bacterium]